MALKIWHSIKSKGGGWVAGNPYMAGESYLLYVYFPLSMPVLDMLMRVILLCIIFYCA